MTSDAEYDKSSVESILEFALELKGKSLSQVVDWVSIPANERNRGDLGTLVEKYFFRHNPGNSAHQPDFPEAGLELKTTGVLKGKDGYRAKERLVLSMINFEGIVAEEWETSTLLEKCKLMLLLFYLYEKGVDVTERTFVLDPLLHSFSPEDERIIRRDWETIREKVRAGKAHELSEGDTYYLGACRKGEGGPNEKLRSQPNSDTGAKARAFSLKPSYMNQILMEHEKSEPRTSIETSQVKKPSAAPDNQVEVSPIEGAAEIGIEQATKNLFSDYVGLTIDEIESKLGLKVPQSKPKAHNRDLVNQILCPGKRFAPELVKAGIEVKTVRLKPSGAPREAMSFPGFKYVEIVNEEWEDSNFAERIERRFLFVVFQIDAQGVERLQKVSFWTMPYEDRLEAQRVWEDTKRRVGAGITELPRSIESRVAHVRPKAKNAKDVIPTPTGGYAVKKAFWLNDSYIKRVLESL